MFKPQIYGLALIIFGAILLVISYPTGLSHLNVVLLTGLAFILLGLIVFIWMLKKGERY